MLLAAFLRVAQFLFNRSVTEGEAALALNIMGRNFAALMRPLDFVQAAPIGFLFLQRVFFLIFGNNDYALRILPLIAGLVSLPLFCMLTRPILNKAGWFISLILFAVSDYLIYFSSELKQYSTDVAVGLAITILALRLSEPHPHQRDRWWFLVCCLFGVWVSHPAWFVLTGGGLVLLWRAVADPASSRRPWWFVYALAFMVSAAINYFISLRTLAGHVQLLNYWQPWFMPFSVQTLTWFIRVAAKYFHNPVGFPIAFVIPAALAAVLGFMIMVRKNRKVAALLGMPVLLCLLASACRKYPFDGRLLLFTVPAALIFMSTGLGGLIEHASRMRKITGWILTMVIVIPVTVLALVRVVHPRQPEELRPVMRYLQRNYQEQDMIYLYYAAVNGFNYYCRQMDFYPTDTLVGVEAREQWDAYLRDVQRLTGRPRVWLVFSHITALGGTNEEKIILDYWDRRGQRLACFRASGASVYLYHMRDR